MTFVVARTINPHFFLQRGEEERNNPVTHFRNFLLKFIFKIYVIIQLPNNFLPYWREFMNEKKTNRTYVDDRRNILTRNC